MEQKMIKKIVILAILMILLIAGNLLANERDPLIIHVVAQEEVQWTLKIWDGIQFPWNIPHYGTWNVPANGCQGDYYEMWALDETIFIESGTLPFTDWFEIVIPITVPSWEDPEQ